MGAQVRKVFSEQLSTLAEQSKNQAESIKESNSSTTYWYRPKDFEGSPLTDHEKICEVFSREEPNQDFLDAIDPNKTGGKTGDLVASSLQVGVLSLQERGFMMRHCSDIRAIGHAMARMGGHGNAAGVFERGMKDYVQRIVTAAGAET